MKSLRIASGRCLIMGAALAGFLVLSGCVSTLTREELAAEYYNLGNAYYALERYEESARYLARAVELDGSLARASYNLARAYIELEQYDRAIELLNRLQAEDDENSVVIETLAYAHYQAGDLEQAAVTYERAIEGNPTDVDLLRNRATIARYRENYRIALGMLERIIEIEPDDPEALQTAAELYEETGDVAQAIAAMRRVRSSLEEGVGAASLYLASLLVTDNRFADALAVLDEVIESQDADTIRAEAEFRKAEILLTAAGEPMLGLDALQRAIGLGFGDAEAASALLARDDLISGEQVRELLAAAELLAEAADESDTGATPGPEGAESSEAEEPVTEPSDEGQ